jgi:vancomycin permeability regulator SanA
VALAALALPVLAVAGSAAFVRAAAAGRLRSEQSVEPTPVALVLGAQVYGNGQPSRFLIGRLELAARLYRAGVVRTILVSGDSLAPEWDEPAAMRRYLLQVGVPDAAIVTDPAGFDTYDSCRRARDVYGVRRLIVVSQRYHLPRAVGTARLLGLDAVGVGDSSVKWVEGEGGRRRAEPWRRGAVRDVLACVKTILDLATRRRPILGPPLEGVILAGTAAVAAG